jgi:hypothetical protein
LNIEKTIMKLHLAFLLVLVTLVIPSTADDEGIDIIDPSLGDLDLEASLTLVSTTADAVTLRLSILNNNEEESRFFSRSSLPKTLPDDVPKDLGLEMDVFIVLSGEEQVNYTAVAVEREALTFPQGYEEIPPGEAVEIEFNILPLYDFPLQGSYSVSYAADDVALACDLTGENCILSISSNTVNVVLEASLGRLLEDLTSQNIRRLADQFQFCTEDQIQTIKDAKKDALECAAKSCECLDTLKGNEDNSYFEMFFGDDKPRSLRAVKLRFKKIKEALAGMISFVCVPQAYCDGLKIHPDDEISSFIFPSRSANPPLKPKEVFICPGYFDKGTTGKDTQKGTLIHDVSQYRGGAGTRNFAEGLENSKKLLPKYPGRALRNADSYKYFCECLREGGGGTWGDPHFKTWLGSNFDFHGECDLVLLDAPSFGGGQGFKVHVRTQLSSNHQYSYVSGLALQIGKDILEVAGHGDYFFNGHAGNPTTPNKPKQIDGHPMYYQSTEKKRHTFTIDLPNEQRLTVAEYRSFVSVSFNSSGTMNDFEDSVGLMGSYSSGSKLGRDGISVFSEPNAFGFEWQVRDEDVHLFQDARPPQYPMTCNMPDQEKQRRALQEVTITKEQAEEACADWPEDDKEACVFDVLAMEDLEMALFNR